MPTHTLTFHVAVIGPSDTEADVEAVRQAITSLNAEFVNRKVTIAFHHWSDLPPGLGSSAQRYIDQSISWRDMDFVVGLLWQKFGTPVEDKLSGTEHEYRQVYDLFCKHQKPDVLFYFKSPTPGAAPDQILLVRNFKRDVRTNALTGSYDAANDLKERVLRHLREKVHQRLETNNQQQRRLGDLPSNRALTVEMVIFSEFPNDNVCVPTIILLKNPRGEEFVFDTRHLNPQDLANWIAKSFGYAATEGRTLFDYLQQCNVNNFQEAFKRREERMPYFNQMWLGNILFCNHPDLRLKKFNICIGSNQGHQIVTDVAEKKKNVLMLELNKPQIINHPDGTKTLYL